MKEKQEPEKNLLDLPPPEGYLEQWEKILTHERNVSSEKTLASILVFRLYDEWLAIASEAIKEIVENKIIHSIPHKNSPILKGTVNIRGQLRLAVSLEDILEIEGNSEDAEAQENPFERMLVLQQDKYNWVVKIHEIFGIVPLDLETMENVPVTVSKSKANYLKGICKVDNKRVGVLEEELIFFRLKRSIT